MIPLQSDWEETRENWNDLVDNWHEAWEPMQPLFDWLISPLGILFSLAFIGVCSVLLLGIVITLWRDKAEAAP